MNEGKPEGSEILEDIISLLSKNRLRNISLINFISCYGFSSVEQWGDSVMIRGTSDKPWIFFSSDSRVEFMELMKKLTPKDLNFASMEDWMLPFILQRGVPKWQLSCLRLYYPEEYAISKEFRSHVVDIDERKAVFILNHYEYCKYTDLEYVKERLTNGPALGIYDRNNLAAFIMTHDDGAMGFLTVLPEHRRKGYAKDLTLEMISRLREKGDLPFVQIEDDNYQSINLAKQLGFVIDQNIHWVAF